MDAQPMSELREGMRTIMTTTLSCVVTNAWVPPSAQRRVVDDAMHEAIVTLERTAFNASIRAARASAGTTQRQHYTSTIRSVNMYLTAQVGPFPDNIIGLQFADGELAPADLVERCYTPVENPDPREIIRRLFVRTLMSAHDSYYQNRELTLDVARALEVSCYNAVVRTSKESEEPPRRQWSSDAFVDIYSTRCGTISTLLDPTSSVCKSYGSTLVMQLLNGALTPDELGDMTEQSLCPQATAAERVEIAARVIQKVDEKESNLFRCPHEGCGARKCTYRQVQRRSLDEAPDYLCYCLVCHHRFTGRS